jgi:hypothetical protein
MKKLTRTSVVMFLAAFLLLSVGATAEAFSAKRVVYFDYNYTPSVKPSEIFLTANSGPYLKKIKWTGWGTNKAIGRGRFIADCASCGEFENKPVTIYFRKLVKCKYAPNVRIYRYGKFHIKDPSRNRTSPWNGNCPSKGWRNWQ